MSTVTDPRDVFRLVQRNCGTCHYWPIQFAEMPFSGDNGSGTLELPCPLAPPPRTPNGKISYENGWRRGSDSCLKWERRRE